VGPASVDNCRLRPTMRKGASHDEREAAQDAQGSLQRRRAAMGGGGPVETEDVFCNQHAHSASRTRGAMCCGIPEPGAHRRALAAGDRQGPAVVGHARETGARRPGNRRPGLLDQLTPVTSEFRARSVGHGPPRPVQVCRTGPRHRGTTQEIPRHRLAVRFLAESRPLNM